MISRRFEPPRGKARVATNREDLREGDWAYLSGYWFQVERIWFDEASRSRRFLIARPEPETRVETDLRWANRFARSADLKRD